MTIFQLLAVLGAGLATFVLIGGLIRVSQGERPDYVTFALALLGILLGFSLGLRP